MQAVLIVFASLILLALIGLHILIRWVEKPGERDFEMLIWPGVYFFIKAYGPDDDKELFYGIATIKQQ